MSTSSRRHHHQQHPYLAIGLLLVLANSALALDNGLALTPPMGWLSWERFTCQVDCANYPHDCISSRLYQQMADRLVADGYARAGYEYVNIDDCWSQRQRHPTLGTLEADTSRFPEGMESLVKYMHARHLKLGLYGDCGTATCDGYPAQLKSEQQLEDNWFQTDAELFAGQWQIDSFKLDGCHLDPSKAEHICPQWARALNATGRPVLVTCEWPFYMLRKLYNEQRQSPEPDFALARSACNAWRYYEDVEDSWLSVLSILDFTIKMQHLIVDHHGPGHWFDPDQLIIGNFALSLDQARAQMALWSLWSAPLFMSNDLRSIEPQMAALLKNEQLIAVDQDRMGVFGLMVAQSADGQLQAFAKPLEPVVRGCPSFAVVYLNRNTLGNSRDISFKVRDLLANLPHDLAARRYNRLTSSAASSSSAPAPEPIDGQSCARLMRLGMSKESGKSLIVRPMNHQDSVAVEEERVYFKLNDLLDDDTNNRTIALNDQLTLRVNPSGVRAIKLIRL